MVESKIQKVFDCMGHNQFNQALAELYHAVTDTVSKIYCAPVSDDECKRFLRKNTEIITATWLGSVIASGMQLAVRSDSDEWIPLENILFDLMRNAATGQEPNIAWRNSSAMMIYQNRKLYSSPNLIWGIALAVITCPVNQNLRISDTY